MAERAHGGAAARAPMFSLREAFGWLSDGVLSGRGDEAVSAVSTDSRRCQPGDLYVALRGERFDGHDFVADVVANGVRAVVVERRLPALDPVVPPVAALIVSDCRQALGRIAGGWRNRFGLPLIAVTGSNGKTTVKEMIAAILRAHVGNDAAFATRGNLNNNVGVPQTLLGLHAGHRAGVVELGMNHPGEIAWLAALSRPTVALVNNAQREHQEFLSGATATAYENGAVFGALATDGVAVFPGDDVCAPIWRDLAGARPVLAFGLDPHRFEVAAAPDATPARFEARIGPDHVTVALAIAGRHNVRNALAAAACCRAIGVPAATIAAGLGRFTPASGRLQRRRGPGGIALIDDSYNANPDSVRAAIDLLADEPGPRMLILGDMGEVGAQGPAFHREVGEYARDRAIDELCAVGQACAETARGFGDRGQHFPSVDALLAAFAVEGEALLRGAGTVLVKGSRFMRMERVVRALTGEKASAEVAH